MLPPTYSRRRRLSEASDVEVYKYESVPKKVKVQTVQIIRGAIGTYYHNGNNSSAGKLYEYIAREMRKEVGVHELTEHARNADDEFLRWLEYTNDVEAWLDGVEYSMRGIDRLVRGKEEYYFGRHSSPDEAIAEFNARMQEAAIGYQYVSGDIVRIDSMHMHKEVVLPALGLLNQERFAAAEQEYRSAHQAFRNGELEDCIIDCGKAFESVLKVIGAARSWPIGANDTASKLIQAAATAGFIAPYASTSLNHLKGLLESSTPTIRNKEGGHGAGTTPRVIAPELAALQLHQTAAMILYLTQRDASLRSAGE
ncbi:hypothetical protein MKK55_23830 [Methylobacterium sp. J-059]|uniref:STM4504/CBY_0614 family protein n=1 Tax=Methylobacterium sp. J-059 TaxID=2836643 RepID=UPI001FB99CC5|nr:hypothetical protein [Methylobacterium sp. J-059]MCJ2041960.1 hypothetical protein [Methylobacterium sp. J-059]